ncbi:hypothetical protein EI427_08265 [Flammeovirga pectinis]|uniref:DUF4384 domain-containing protein n=1 Tax=Flammeovirga pectinis TaxID=2494373 RepID=A0A3Q9FL91_9BACT|nr:hypothetical protein [Flammeovirga pectinis]AZQ62230.1 hypothetical protein EI427_08265 [Flammeovirga pectinis]
MYKNILLFFLIVTPSVVFAQKTKKVSAAITEPLLDSYTVGTFKEQLLRKAQIQALADQFGTNLSSSTDLQVNNSSTDLMSLNTSTVKGEWIKTTNLSYEWFIETIDGEQTVYLKCAVSGKGREITTPNIKIESATLSCNQSSDCETNEFKEGQSLYVSFKSPKDGYVSVFMREEGIVYRLFPYSSLKGEQGDALKIESDKEYILFDPQKASDFENLSSRQIDELQLSTMGKDKLFNRLYVIYSPTPFTKPILETGQGGIKTISPEEFQSWLTTNKGNNTDFQDKLLYFTIEK